MKKLLFTLLTLISAFTVQAQNCNILNVTWAHTPTPNDPYLVTFTNNTPPPTGTNIHTVYVVLYAPYYQLIQLPYGATSVNFSYPGPGTYDAGYSLYVEDSLTNTFICHDTISDPVILAPLPCLSNISVTDNGGGSYTFTATNVGGGTSPAYNWTLGDGTTATGASVTHTYANSNVYYVSLSTSANGTNCTAYTTVSYFNGTLPCSQYTAGFNHYMYPGGPNVEFNNTSTLSTIPSANILELSSWDFGDGNTSTQYYPYHQYSSYGTYTVTLTTQWVDSLTQQVYCTDVETQTITLTQPPNLISGNIGWDSSLNVTQTSLKVWLITYDSVTNIIDAVDSLTTSGVNGSISYTFNNVPSGAYRVKAAVLNGAAGANLIAPTYHWASTYWGTAAVVSHYGLSSINNHIYMQSGSSTAGPGFIAGNVTQGAGKGTGAGVPGLLVILRGATNDMVRFTYTDANGDYSFGNIPAGTYNVYPESMPQITTPSATINIASGSYTVSGIDFEKTSTAITPVDKTTGIKNLPAQDIFAIYPNPTDGMVNLNWNSNVTGQVSINVVDMIGRQVMTTNANTNAATNLNLNHVPAGVYFIKVASDKAQHTQKLIIQ